MTGGGLWVLVCLFVALLLGGMAIVARAARTDCATPEL